MVMRSSRRDGRRLEPLVYIPGRFGMQNKDMFCVTDKGCELLSDVTPTDKLLRVG
jgi:Xaa-Pro aminopeptidase